MASLRSPVPEMLAARQLEPGTVVAERYRVLSVIGEGRMGRVYAAEHRLLRKRLALKVLHADLVAVPELAARFEREAMALGTIDHPNVVAATDFGRLPDGSPFLVMEFVEGRTLRTELERGALSPRRSLHVARQIASALAACHALGIVHRDLKPENVMLVRRDEDGEFVKVLDFGIARFSDPDKGAAPLTRASTVFGTPEYMAPEQALGQAVDARADLFSLGVIAFEMLTGSRPYDAKASGGVLSQQLSAAPPSIVPPAPAGELSSALDRAVSRLLARSPDARFQSAEELLGAFDAAWASFVRSSWPAPPMAGVPHEPPANATVRKALGLPTFLPGDPLPAYELSHDSAAANDLPRPVRAGASGAEGDDAVTRLALPAVNAPSAPPRAAPPARRTLQRVERAALGAYRSALELSAGLHARLPDALRERTTPAQLLLAVLLAIPSAAVCSLVLVVALAHRARNHEPAPQASPSAVAVASAAPSASAAPEPAASARPDSDADLALTAAGADLRAGHDADALAKLARVLSQHPSLRSDERVDSIVYRGAQSLDKKTQDTAFALLDGTLGRKGAELVYRLAIDKSVRESVRQAAVGRTKSEAFSKVAPADVYTAAKLRFSESCDDRHRLLDMAGRAGGPRTLEVLRELSTSDGCGASGKDDCYPCLRADGALAAARAAIEQRAATPAGTEPK